MVKMTDTVSLSFSTHYTGAIYQPRWEIKAEFNGYDRPSTTHMETVDTSLTNKQLFTFLSKSLSHMSLIMQPAPRMKKASAPNRISIQRSGRWPGLAANAMLHVHGHNNSSVPKQEFEPTLTFSNTACLKRNLNQPWHSQTDQPWHSQTDQLSLCQFQWYHFIHQYQWYKQELFIKSNF